MTVPAPAEFVDGLLAAPELNTKVFDLLAWLFDERPAALQVVTAFDLTQGVFSSVDSWTAPEDGLYLAFSSVRCSSVRGNKELRLTTDGQYEDADPWIATSNQFGVATPAFSSCAVAGLADVAAGTGIEYGVFVDTPDACSVLRGNFGALWLRNRLS